METSTETIGEDNSRTSRVYAIWPAQEDLPAVTSGPWHQERRWLVLDVTDGIAASYVVEGPVEHVEAIRRAAEMCDVTGCPGGQPIIKKLEDPIE